MFYSAHRCFNELVTRKRKDLRWMSENSQEWLELNLPLVTEIDVDINYFTVPLIGDHFSRLNHDFPNIETVNLICNRIPHLMPEYADKRYFNKMKNMNTSSFNFKVNVDDHFKTLEWQPIPEGLHKVILDYSLDNFFWEFEMLEKHLDESQTPYVSWFKNLINQHPDYITWESIKQTIIEVAVHQELAPKIPGRKIVDQ